MPDTPSSAWCSKQEASEGVGLFAHTGVLRAARELAYQVDRMPYTGGPEQEQKNAEGEKRPYRLSRIRAAIDERRPVAENRSRI